MSVPPPLLAAKAAPTVSWAPPWAAGKIDATYTVFNPTDPPQRITMRCLVCNETSQRTCDAGNARDWITRFAVVHRRLHPW
jgi:hypothetical protein